MDIEELPGGIAGADFPLSLYDRPTLAFSNLLMRGDIDAATRSLLSPQTLTPTELQTFRARLLKGKKPNPILKTILDVTTNPIFVIGLALSIAYPLVGVKPLHALFTGASGEVAAVGPWASQMHSAFTNLRKFPGFIRVLTDYVRETSKFGYVFGTKMNKIFAGLPIDRVTELGGRAVAANWENKAAWVQKIIPAKYGISFEDIGSIAPGLGKSKTKEMVEMGKRTRNLLDDIRSRFPEDWTPKFMEMWSELQLKGVQLRGRAKAAMKPGAMLRDYMPHVMAPYDKYTAEGLKTTLQSLPAGERAGWLDKMVKYNTSPNLLKRGLGGIGKIEDFQEMANLGWLHPKVMPALKLWISDVQTQFTGELGQIWAQHGNNFSKGVTSPFLERTFDWLKQGPWEMALGKKLEARTPIYNSLLHIGSRLKGATTPQAFVKEMASVGEFFATPPQYSLTLTDVLPKYLKSVGPTYAWHMKKFGPAIMKFANQAQGWQKSYVHDQLLPLVRGFKTLKGTLKGAASVEKNQRMYSWITKHPLFDSPFPQNTRKWMADYFSSAPGKGGIGSLSADVANWFHLSTLGFPNLSPTLKNVGQTWITTANVVGVKGMKDGLAMLVPRWGKYIGMRGKGVASEIAFKRAFPEFVKEMGVAENVLTEAVSTDVMRNIPKAVLTTFDKVKKGMMLPFQTSEVFLNRLLSFYSAYGTGLKSGMAPEAARQIGGVMVTATQFPGGPLNMPRALMDLSPALRQYMHFPLRYLGFLHSSLRMGPNPNVLNFSTIGRGLMGSTAAYYGAKNLLGTDISAGLLYGALPGPTYEHSPFFPFPFVPPVVGVGGGVVAAIATGDAKYMQSSLPLLVPGGIGIRRMYRSLAPRYADYKNKTEEGKIPIYNKDRALIGTYSPFELFLRSLGVAPSSQAAEQGAAGWLLKQRDKMRQYRREYLNAIFQNDLRKADEINKDFQSQYPELGPITIKKSDITALKNRREITRLDRILKGFPKQYRPLFESAVSEATLGSIAQDTENTPQNLDYYSGLFNAMK